MHRFLMGRARRHIAAGCEDGLRGVQPQNGDGFHNFTFRNRSALATTDTELKLMAAAAIIGLSSSPKDG
jgi:hypothetical protein